ncbi:MAG: hypothetical protein IJX84_07140 [Clostridia bacterium]|nr:hypothetical protein [Clostridia bacterium]
MKTVKGAAMITHVLKEYGNGKSMVDGIKRIAVEQRQQGFQQGVNYALQNLSFVERLVGRSFKR